MRKATLLIIATFLVATLLSSGAQLAPSRAEGQPGNDFPVTLEIVGVVQSISVNQLTLADGTIVKINKQTKGLSSALKPGVTVTVTAQMDDEDLVAAAIVLGDVSSTDDISATPDATLAATPGKGKGNNDDKGNGQGNNNDQGNGKGKGNGNGDNKGQNNGKGNGNGQGNNNDQGNGKGKGNGNGDNNGKGKNDDQQLAACLKNTKQPVVTRLAEAFGVPYSDIMTWHCQHKGFGEIARAYILSKKTGMSVAQIFALRDSGKGWGEIMQNAKLDPQDLAPGVVIHGKQGKGSKD